MSRTPDVFFLPAGDEQRLCVFHAPAGTPRSAVLFLHPFAEEMNKSRRMAALASRALADAGHAVLQIDLRGCGDSSADFGDATWSDWQADAQLALDWLARRHPGVPLWLWGLRAGALLAARDWGRAVNLLLWQPMPSGKLALQQFLRLKVAAEMATGGGKGLMEQMKAQLAAGEAVEVAGYRLHPALASGLEAARLTPAGPTGRLVWIEVATQAGDALKPASLQALQTWQDAGWTVSSQGVEGPSFWATTEIELAPALISATVETL